MSRVRLGCVAFLNAKPLVHGHSREVALMPPAEIARQLADNRLEGGLCPVFAWLREPSRYVAADGIGIACRGAVHSVILAHRGPLTELRRVRLDGASRSSANLLRVLLAEFHDSRPEFVDLPEPASGDERLRAAGDGMLLIGDAAIRFRRRRQSDVQVLDLGEEWLRCTALPFVFAVWLLRADLPDLAGLGDRLRGWAAENADRVDELARRYGGDDPAFAAHYLGECIRYRIGRAEKRGLAKYAELLAKYGLIAANPRRLRWV
ncbi:MAG: menaquinone biosynthesis protein [Verrucomicrobia bacterium]|nr:menaquinone biosynthesis protein [Verrucomicrobiota bacterium]